MMKIHVANHAARKSYVDQHAWTAVNMTVAPGSYGAGPGNLGATLIVDPGYDIDFYAVAIVPASGTVLDYWDLHWHLSDIGDYRGAIRIPMAQTAVNQTFAAMLPMQTHSTGSNIIITLRQQRASGSGTFTVPNDAHFLGATVFYKRH